MVKAKGWNHGARRDQYPDRVVHLRPDSCDANLTQEDLHELPETAPGPARPARKNVTWVPKIASHEAGNGCRIIASRWRQRRAPTSRREDSARPEATARGRANPAMPLRWLPIRQRSVPPDDFVHSAPVSPTSACSSEVELARATISTERLWFLLSSSQFSALPSDT